MYMYIIFSKILLVDSVKAVHINILANNCKLHKIAKQSLVIFKKLITSDMHHRITYICICILIFSKIGLVDQSKPVHTNLFAKKIASGIILQLPIVILKKSFF